MKRHMMLITTIGRADRQLVALQVSLSSTVLFSVLVTTTKPGLQNFFHAAIDLSFERHTPWFLRVRRYLRRCRRGLFGSRTPHWLAGAYSLLRWGNLFEAVPTVGELLTHPWHFYRRLPQILDQRKPWIKTPLPFFATQLVYGLLLVKLFGLGSALSTETSANLLLAGVALSCPIWMVALSFCMFVCTYFYEASRQVSASKYTSAYFDLFTILNPSLYLIPLDPRTYRSFRWTRFGWGVFYFGLIAAAIVGSLALMFGYSAFYLELYERDNPLGRELALYLLVLAAWFALQRALISPYVALLRNARTAPTQLMYGSDAYVIVQLASIAARLHPSLWTTKFVLRLMISAWRKNNARIKPELCDLRRLSQDDFRTAIGRQRKAFDDLDLKFAEKRLYAISMGESTRERLQQMMSELAGIKGRFGFDQQTVR
jgi:hypothetical protein